MTWCVLCVLQGLAREGGLERCGARECAVRVRRPSSMSRRVLAAWCGAPTRIARSCATRRRHAATTAVLTSHDSFTSLWDRISLLPLRLAPINGGIRLNML